MDHGKAAGGSVSPHDVPVSCVRQQQRAQPLNVAFTNHFLTLNIYIYIFDIYNIYIKYIYIYLIYNIYILYIYGIHIASIGMPRPVDCSRCVNTWRGKRSTLRWVSRRGELKLSWPSLGWLRRDGRWKGSKEKQRDMRTERGQESMFFSIHHLPAAFTCPPPCLLRSPWKTRREWMIQNHCRSPSLSVGFYFFLLSRSCSSTPPSLFHSARLLSTFAPPSVRSRLPRRLHAAPPPDTHHPPPLSVINTALLISLFISCGQRCFTLSPPQPP